MNTLEERINKLVEGKTPAQPVPAQPKLENLKKSEVIKVDQHGGRRMGSGRKTKEETLIIRGTQAYFDNHRIEEVDIQIVNPKTGKSKIIKKPRIVRVLELLYDIGVKDRNVAALNAWLNHNVGRPVTRIGGSDNDPPIRFFNNVDLERIIEKAYGQSANRLDD